MNSKEFSERVLEIDIEEENILKSIELACEEFCIDFEDVNDYIDVFLMEEIQYYATNNNLIKGSGLNSVLSMI